MRPNFNRPAALVFVLLLLGSVESLAQTVGQAKQKEPLAVVGGQTIYDDDLVPFVQGQVFQLRLQEYEVKSKALENLVNQKAAGSGGQEKRHPHRKTSRARGGCQGP